MGLKVEIFTRNIDINDRINDYVNKKVSKLDRFLPGIDEARVDLNFIKSARSSADRQVAQITIHGKGYILRSEERADDIFTAIDASLSKIERQIERFKGKRARGRGDGTPASGVVPEIAGVEENQQSEPVIAKRKHFTLVPMNEREAIEQMTLLGHDEFFVFFNVDTNAINVLYLRRDGTYGLIEPEIG